MPRWSTLSLIAKTTLSTLVVVAVVTEGTASTLQRREYKGANVDVDVEEGVDEDVEEGVEEVIVK